MLVLDSHSANFWIPPWYVQVVLVGIGGSKAGRDYGGTDMS